MGVFDLIPLRGLCRPGRIAVLAPGRSIGPSPVFGHSTRADVISELRRAAREAGICWRLRSLLASTSRASNPLCFLSDHDVIDHVAGLILRGEIQCFEIETRHGEIPYASSVAVERERGPIASSVGEPRPSPATKPMPASVPAPASPSSGPVEPTRPAEQPAEPTPEPSRIFACSAVPGVTFAFNSSFVRPGVVEHLKEIEALAFRYPEAKIMVFAHTDAVDSDLYNKKLSERRAWSTVAFITDDTDAWETLYNHHKESWGLKVVQEILAHLGHDPGPLDGVMGDRTRAAMRALLGLPDDAAVANDAKFRSRLFRSYFQAAKHDVDLPRERFVTPGYMGCSEFNPVEPVDGAHEPNRRVHVFFFRPDQIPDLPCRYADIAPCQLQIADTTPRHNASFRCAFYDDLCRECTCNETARSLVEIRLYDHARQFVAEAPYRVSVNGQVFATGKANRNGFVRLVDVPTPGRCEIEWSTEPDTSGDSYEYNLDLYLQAESGLPAAEAAAQRLHNLGYPDALDLETRIRRFQREYGEEFGLHVDGQLDTATIDAIKVVHDSVKPVLVHQ